MMLVDFIYIFLVSLFVILGVVHLFILANKKRKRSIDNYLKEKEQRKEQFTFSKKL